MHSIVISSYALATFLSDLLIFSIHKTFLKSLVALFVTF